MFFLSGALFRLTNVLLLLRVLATIYPLSYGVDSMRALLIGVSHFGVALDMTLLGMTATAFPCIASYRLAKLEV